MRWFPLLPCLAVAVLLAAASAQAQTYVFDNTTQSRTGAATIGTGEYASFSTDAQAYTLSSLTLNMRYSGGSSGTIKVGLYAANTDNTVGGQLIQLASFALSALTGSYANYSVTGLSTYTLAASTRYYIGLIDTGSNGRWGTDGSTAGTGVAGEYHAATPTTPLANGAMAYMMQVGVTAVVPEPASIALFGTAIAGLIAARRRKRG